MTLEQIIRKIYLETYSFDNLKEFLFPALRLVENQDQFFDVIFDIVKEYS